MATDTSFEPVRFLAGRRTFEAGRSCAQACVCRATLPAGRGARLLATLKTIIVVCGLAAVPFAADLASHARVRAATAAAHVQAIPSVPGSAIATPLAAPVPLQS